MEIGKKATNEDRSHSLHLKLIVFAGLLLLQIVLFVLAARYVRDYFGFVLAIIPILEFIVFIYIFNDSSNPMYKLAWVFLILTIPFFGILIYLFVAFNVKQKAMHQRFSTMANRYGPLYDKISNEGVHRDLKEEDGLASLTSSYLKNTGDFPVFKAQGVDYHNDGRIHFDDMLVELEKAEKFIFMEYFILADGLMWQSILDILKKKVKEGVEVRLLLDGMMAFINLPRDFVEEMEGYGIKARLFNVMRVNLSVHQNHRDHRKIMVIDGEVAYTGGLNIADEYINEKKRFGYWKDTAVKIQGDAVDSFTVMFLEVWNVLEGGHLEERYLRESKSSLAKDGFVIPYYDTPYNGEEIGKKVYLDIIHQAQESIYIMTPYFIIDYEILYALCYSAKSGVDVKIILPHIPDKRWIFYTSRTFYGELLRAGVEVYEYLPGFLHAKSFASDGNKAVVGTVNMDYRSFYLHLECGAYFYNTPVSKELEEDFIETLGVSQKITMDIVEDFPFYQRMIGRLMRLIAPLL